MPNVPIESLLAEKSGLSEQEVYKILSSLAEILKEEVYEKGNLAFISSLGLFKQDNFSETGKEMNQTENTVTIPAYKKLGFVPVPTMNNDTWYGWIWEHK
ncbi:MAG: hypothetical protein EOO10_19835 [Chitinophagaceae bacterium]|nr:MAG: hypothetical protein EOO10_19835 [Chitinophagaceae bacterium]